MWTLYYAQHTCALASHITLEEAAADYRAVRVSFAEGEQKKPEFLAVNPKGRVPALVTERGVVTETPAILAFIAQSLPASGLAPLDDAFEFARAQAFNAYLCATVHVNHAHGRRGYRWADDEAAHEAMRRKVPQTMAESCGLIEREMLTGPWVLGERFSICDPYLFTITGWLEGDGVDLASLPRLREHRSRMAERPAVQRVLDEQAAAA